MSTRALPGSKSLMLVGAVLVVFGVLLLVSPAAVGAAVVKLVSLVLIVTGLIQLLQGFRGGKAAQKLVSALLGALVAGVGVMVWRNPELGSGFLTALLMMFFVVNGLWKLWTGFRYRNARGWAWLLLSGLVSLLFVYLLWRQWPLGGAWAIGVLVGLDLLLSGVALIILAAGLRRVRSTGYLDTISL